MLAIEDWRRHWGIKRDPFLSKDAEHDSILLERGVAAAHPEFEKVLGEVGSLGPSIVFGEKGSGKSGLRMMVKQRLEEWNGAHPDRRVLVLQYIDFNPYLEHLARIQEKVRPKKRTPWSLADHVDAILSLGVTRLVDLILGGQVDAKALGGKQRTELLLLAGLYHSSEQRTTNDVVRKLRSKLKGPIRGSMARRFALLLAIAAVFIGIGWGAALVPELESARQWIVDRPWIVAVVFGAWLLGELWSQLRIATLARAPKRSVRILPSEASALRGVLREVRGRDRAEFALPHDRDEESRFKLLKHFLHISDQLGYPSVAVLMDRVDEPGSVAGQASVMRGFVEPMVNLKFLTLKELSLKLFLPIELREIERTASSDTMKQMRFDRWHVVEELRWSGSELFDIADRRLAASMGEGAEELHLDALFGADVGRVLLERTLGTLGTPRLVFAFLNDLFQEHARSLPADPGSDATEWMVGRPVFERVSGHWLDKAGAQRRLLNG